MYAIAVHGYHHFINIFWELADANLGKEGEIHDIHDIHDILGSMSYRRYKYSIYL